MVQSFLFANERAGASIWLAPAHSRKEEKDESHSIPAVAVPGSGPLAPISLVPIIPQI